MRGAARKGDGRARNRLGRFGSHLLRRALRELPAHAAGDEANMEDEVPARPSHNCSLALRELTGPLAACGTSFHCQLMLSAC